MTSISEAQFEALLSGFAHEAVHLETRDAYGTAIELPYMAKWAAGEPDDLAWLNDWCDTLRVHVSAGRSVRRARIVSLPLSDYQRWSYSIADPMVEAGEDIRVELRDRAEIPRLIRDGEITHSLVLTAFLLDDLARR